MEQPTEAAGQWHAIGERIPAWARRTEGEPRLAVSVCVLAIVALQLLLPTRYQAGPRWLLPALELTVMAATVAANPVRLNRDTAWLRAIGLTLCGLLTVANCWSATRLVIGLVNGHVSDNATALLTSGGSIWLTNVMVFGLWYWEFDRGGPAARAAGRKPLPDFLFVQMQNPTFADRDWEPEFVDYLYLSFTNATAFSPTDVMPMSRWAKLLMMVQSAISLITVALVISRAINVLK